MKISVVMLCACVGGTAGEDWDVVGKEEIANLEEEDALIFRDAFMLIAKIIESGEIYETSEEDDLTHSSPHEMEDENSKEEETTLSDSDESHEKTTEEDDDGEEEDDPSGKFSRLLAMVGRLRSKFSQRTRFSSSQPTERESRHNRVQNAGASAGFW